MTTHPQHAASSREAARQPDGRFGTQPLSEPPGATGLLTPGASEHRADLHADPRAAVTAWGAASDEPGYAAVTCRGCDGGYATAAVLAVHQDSDCLGGQSTLARDLRVGDAVVLDESDTGPIPEVTSLDGGLDGVSIEFDRDPSTVATYPEDERFFAVYVEDVDLRPGQRGYAETMAKQYETGATPTTVRMCGRCGALEGFALPQDAPAWHTNLDCLGCEDDRIGQ